MALWCYIGVESCGVSRRLVLNTINPPRHRADSTREINFPQIAAHRPTLERNGPMIRDRAASSVTTHNVFHQTCRDLSSSDILEDAFQAAD